MDVRELRWLFRDGNAERGRMVGGARNSCDECRRLEEREDSEQPESVGDASEDAKEDVEVPREWVSEGGFEERAEEGTEDV